MSIIRTVLVARSGCGEELVPVQAGHQEVELEADPDNALERVRRWYGVTWNASVHALRWIFPLDWGLSEKDDSPFLVLYVDDAGRLSTEFGAKDHARSPAARYGNRIQMAAVRHSPSEPWSAPEWMPRMNHWIRSELGHHSVLGISQVRVCTNGAVIKVETAGGNWFMKTVPVRFGYEPALLRFLDRNLPGACPFVARDSPDTETHITQEIQGIPLRTSDDPAEWIAALGDVARFQSESVAYTEQMKALGLPYQTLDNFSSGLEETFSRLVSLQKGALHELNQEELDRVVLLMDKATHDAAVLGECAIPESLIHGDLNESNIFRTPTGGTSLIDWTFSKISHPFFALGFSLFAASDREHRMNSVWPELRDAYLGPWQRYCGRRQLLAGLEAASRLFWIETAHVIGNLVGELRQELPGVTAHLPPVLRRSLSAFAVED
jgi:hypothetical protein